MATKKSSLRAVPGTVWALGFVSMFMDISSEMIHALLPIYMATVLGTSVLAVGIIEGIAEATASVVKVFSGALSDRLGKRKLLAALGYGLGALSKPVFPLAGTLAWLVHDLWIASAKAFEAHRVMRWLLMQRRLICEAQPMGFATLWIR